MTTLFYYILFFLGFALVLQGSVGLETKLCPVLVSDPEVWGP